MSETAATIQTLRGQFGDKIGDSREFRGETTLYFDKTITLEFATALKKLGYDLLLDICSVDHFGEEPRFEMVYEFYSLATGLALRVKSKVSEEDLEVPSLVSIFQTANWHEREVYDMMGIKFKGHPDLRRILMWEGYPYHPLRKEFPLEGKESDAGKVAFTRPVPLEGGPFVTEHSLASGAREPRSKAPDLE
jgi:NADH-quinone oxidoreductase subunit C